MRLTSKSGFSLVELLIVMAIILLLVGLLVPVLLRARGGAKQSSCTSQLRQIGIGISIYREDAGGEPRSCGLDFLVDNLIVRDVQLLKCPADADGGLMSSHYRCERIPISREQSYYTPFAPQLHVYSELQKVDDNPGIAACRCHGTRSNDLNGDFCYRIPFVVSGTVLRLRNDTSVVVRYCSGENPDGTRTWSLWRMLTDKPGPP
jgi:prepilin-type N-terminal cleavage/methylation domain-containing protein